MVPDVSGPSPSHLTPVGSPATERPGPGFQEVLDSREVRFSKHASRRLQQRNIELSPSDLERIERATDQAADKGSRDALFLMGNLGLIVNIKNRTVLTAIEQSRLREGIFTNIDSTVIIPKE